MPSGGSNIIKLVAGTMGASGSGGDDGPATNATLTNPTYVGLRPGAGFVVADAGAARIRQVDAAGTITTVAGTGTAGNSGDDGAATSAQVSAPYGLAVTADGGFLFADRHAHVVRKVDASGTITRVAGTGTPGYSGDDGVATAAQLNGPIGISVTPAGQSTSPRSAHQRPNRGSTGQPVWR